MSDQEIRRVNEKAVSSYYDAINAARHWLSIKTLARNSCLNAFADRMYVCMRRASHTRTSAWPIIGQVMDEFRG